MKRLNRKGFTLVELLAVIVILAIVMGITLVTVLPTLQKSRQSAYELTAQTAADFFEKEYQLYMIGETDKIPSDILTQFSNTTGNAYKTTGVAFTKAMVISAGLKPENYVSGTWYIVPSTGRVCVQLVASTNTTATSKNNLAGKKEAGEYYDTTGTAKSSSCP